MSYNPFPPVDGTPGSAAPAEALQVGGTDGTNLRARLLDSSGRAYVVQKNNALLAPTTVSVTTTVTTETATAGVDGQCVVVTIKNIFGAAWNANVCVRVRNTTSGITTSYQNAGYLANATSSQLYFNLPVSNGDSISIDLIGIVAVGASGVSVAAVLSPLSIPTDLRADGRSKPEGNFSAQYAGGATAGSVLIGAVAGWRPLIATVSVGANGAGAAGTGQCTATVGGTGVNLIYVPVNAPAAATIAPAQGILCDTNVSVNAVATGGAVFAVVVVTFDWVPA